MMTETTETTETLEARIARLHDRMEAYTTGASEPSAARLKSLAVAHPKVDDALFIRLCAALRLARASSVVVPAHRFEGLSRGRGWARKGKGTSAIWGEREDGGYRLTPGKWTVGGNDGFSRKGEDKWEVEHVTVGEETWTIAG